MKRIQETVPEKRLSQSGMALVIALMILVLLSALASTFALTVTSSQNLSRRDTTKSMAFYGAHAGLEKLTANLGTLFTTNYAPTGTQITVLTYTPPNISNILFVNPQGGSGYEITYPQDANGLPVATTRNILSGPYQGFVGMITPYTITVTARYADGSEARLRRVMQTVGIPVFQFGIFSENDLSFFAGPDFDFGGRVHTNGNLFLASGATLTLADRVTAVGEVVRTNLSNGWAVSTGYTGNVRVLTSPGSYRNLATSEGSLTGTLGSGQNEPTWTNVSLTSYNGNLRNGRTGARRLDLPLVSLGATPIDLIRRPPPDENVNNLGVYTQRYYSLASLRILLSDTSDSITTLPTIVGATSPVLLGNLTTDPIAGYTVNATHPPLSTSSGSSSAGYRFPAGTPSLGGYLKIEMQNTAGNWQDVTLEILNLGIAGRNQGSACSDPNPDAIIRLQRVKDSPANNAPCGVGSTLSTDYWPNALYDSREGYRRDDISTGSTTIPLGGVMHYVELDVNNLTRWFNGTIGTSGSSALNVTGHTVYFSDRRGNKDASANETGEYGFEDVVNTPNANGDANGSLDTGEDFNGNATLDIYGQTPWYPTGVTPSSPLDSTARPWTGVTSAIARSNRAIFFRRALKVVHGAEGEIMVTKLAIVSENPVYVQGNYNASSSGFGDPHSACSVIADSVTLLSNAWNDRTSFLSPANPGGRNASDTWYRMAIIAGKGISFPHPSGYSTYQDFGTDGGMHNFLRFLEDWGGNTLSYRGSVVSFFISRQGNGTYKCCTNVYSPPSRGYRFDTDFLNPNLLPPWTPMFRDNNVTGFTQLILPGQ
jgi:hypothetical protein